MDESLAPFLNPKGVVVIGASASPEKLGYGVARNLASSGYRGAIHFVSQSAGRLFDRPVYAGVSTVPDPVDLALILVPPAATTDVLEACGRRGIRAAVIMSAGFREAGPDGQHLEAECMRVATSHGMRVLGPNCIGTIDTHLPLDTTFLQPPMPSAGNIGFISHSGAFCAAIIDWARGQHFGFSQVVSLGNQADVAEAEMMSLVAADPHTRVLALYMEGVSDGREFVRRATEISRRKPIVALKVGRSESGQRAAASHTGALAGIDHAYSAAFEKSGVLRAGNAEQLFDWARALGSCPSPLGRRVAILTNAGGPGVIAADSLEAAGLQLAPLSAETRGALAKRLPPAASVGNPVDMLASASPADYAACLGLALEDPSTDSVLLILPPPPMFKAEDVAASVIPLQRASVKPVLVVLMGSTLTAAAAERFASAGIPTFPFPERAVSAMGALVRYAEHRSAARPAQQEQASAGAPANHATPSGETLVEAAGIIVARTELAKSPAEAVIAADGMGYPVVLKIASRDISHKSDMGGVLLGRQDGPAVAEGYTILMDRTRRANPQAQIDGVAVQQQAAGGLDVILGAVRDPTFGPLMMFGAGGVEVEGKGDVAFALAPLTVAEAERMIEKTWAGRQLRGFRGVPPADREAVVQALLGLSGIMAVYDDLAEIEINPLRVFERGQGVCALDIRLSRLPDFRQV